MNPVGTSRVAQPPRLANEPVSAVASPALDFDTIYARHAGFVWRVLRGLGVPPARVSDATQDVFLVVHRRMHEFDGRHPITTWLFAIARRIAANDRRKHKWTQRHEPLDAALTAPGPDPIDSAERRAAGRLMSELLEGLDERKRSVFVLAEIEQLTAPEISAVTRIPINTVYTLLYRARLELTQALARREARKP